MIKAIRKFFFILGFFSLMCAVVWAVFIAMDAELQRLESENARLKATPKVITVAYASHLKTPIDWDLLEPRRVLPTMPERKPE